MLIFTLVEAKVASYRASRHEAKEAEIHNKWPHINADSVVRGGKHSFLDSWFFFYTTIVCPLPQVNYIYQLLSNIKCHLLLHLAKTREQIPNTVASARQIILEQERPATTTKHALHNTCLKLISPSEEYVKTLCPLSSFSFKIICLTSLSL